MRQGRHPITNMDEVAGFFFVKTAELVPPFQYTECALPEKTQKQQVLPSLLII